MVSLAEIQEVPTKNLILLVGRPGSGKTTFCQQAVLQNLALDRPIICVTTECGPSDAEKDLRERGLGEVELGLLSFVDAYSKTVGLSIADRPDTAGADCDDLSSIDIAISKLQERIGRKGVLLVFDSLTSPYMFNGSEILRFMRQTLSRFAARGNSVLACIDEGCGQPEDLVTMMSMANGIIKMEVADGLRVLNVVKHPTVEPTRIEVPTTKIMEKLYDLKFWDVELSRRVLEAEQMGAASKDYEEELVNVFWPNFARWSVMLWDPKRFPEMTYELWKAWGLLFKEIIPMFPWRVRLLFRLSMPKNLSKVKDMKKMANFFQLMKQRGWGIVEYLEDISKTDEHYFRIHEGYECWGLGEVGATMASFLPPAMVAMCQALESWKGLEREWNVIETKCMGLGDPYCEWKVVPGEIDELKDSLKKESSAVQTINERLMHRLMGFLLDGKPLLETRERLGNDFLLPSMGISLPAIVSERYRMAQRMGGAKAGKEVGENLMNTGMAEDEAVKRVLNLLEHCKVGKITADETIKIKQNCEVSWTKFFTKGFLEEPSCYFTTGFLNGFFSAVKNQHVKEVKCIAMGDPYCEWEFR
jgi:predicted hydrocarbon binding protein/KaiC/GvpD/RAD55 family RecA-like ATPase